MHEGTLIYHHVEDGTIRWVAPRQGAFIETVSVYPHGMAAIREVWSKAPKRDGWTVERWWTVHPRPGALLVATHEARAEGLFVFPEPDAEDTFEEEWLGVRVMTWHPAPVEWSGDPPWFRLDPVV